VVADTALQTWLSHISTNWHKPDEVASLIKNFLIALMFSDNLDLAAERIRALMPKLPGWELRDILVTLAVSTVPRRTDLLLETLLHSNNDLWYEWAHAVGLMPTEDQRSIIQALLTNPKWTNSWAQPSFRGRDVVDVFIPVIQADNSFRETLKATAFSDSPSPMRDFARHLLVTIGDSESAIVALQASLTDPALRSLAEAAIHKARWYPHPDHRGFPDRNAPRALTSVRRLLLHAAYGGDESSREWARNVLVRLDVELENSYPIEEPRHPDLASGLAWPMVSERVA
jgi:hypothetical protein